MQEAEIGWCGCLFFEFKRHDCILLGKEKTDFFSSNSLSKQLFNYVPGNRARAHRRVTIDIIELVIEINLKQISNINLVQIY